VRSPSLIRLRLARLVAGALVTLVATGCVAAATPAAVTAPSTTASVGPVSAASVSPAIATPTETAPSAVTDSTDGTPAPTTQTDWGAILDTVPDAFPRYPGAATTESPREPVSAALEAGASLDEVASWYRDALGSAGYSSLDLSTALEDGSRVLDAATGAPGCRVQLTFHPRGGSTMIIVLYGAGCVSGAAG
jgi:hypothetical protein